MDKSNLGNDRAVLRDLTNFLNTPGVTGASVPDDAKQEIAALTSAPPMRANGLPALDTAPAIAPLTPAPAPAKVIDGSKIFYTGRLKAGKDYVAGLTGAKIFGFSEPLYFLLNYFFGITDKDRHGARKFLQQVGEWGKGNVSEEYPISPERAIFVNLVREHAANGFSGHAEEVDPLRVNWLNYGHDQDIWLNAVDLRTSEFLLASPGARAAIVNVRFEFEFKRMQAAGFRHYHVMTSAKTWAERLQKDGLNAQSPVVRAVSEKLAQALDADVTRKISAQRTGPKLNVIWNDSAPPPSPRLYTVAEFLAAVNVQPQAQVVDTMVI